jgi:hypothetical protein
MVPKRSKTPGSGTPGSAAQQGHPSQTSSNVTSQPEQASELVPPTEVEVSSNASAPPAEDTAVGPPSAADVTNAIEYERVELMQIQAMLKCLYEVLLYADDDDSVMHADVANVCARLINESVRRLGDLLMRGSGGSSRNEVDESASGESSDSEE